MSFVTLLFLLSFQCADLDECRSRPCGTGARCTNQIGGYTCECLTGRTGDPYSTKGCSSNRNPPQGTFCLRFTHRKPTTSSTYDILYSLVRKKCIHVLLLKHVLWKMKIGLVYITRSFRFVCCGVVAVSLSRKSKISCNIGQLD